MNAFGRLVLLGIALVLSGCATTQYFAPSPRVGQRKVYLPSNRNILGVDETRSDGVVEVYMVPTVGDPLFNGTVSFGFTSRTRAQTPTISGSMTSRCATRTAGR